MIVVKKTQFRAKGEGFVVNFSQKVLCFPKKYYLCASYLVHTRTHNTHVTPYHTRMKRLVPYIFLWAIAAMMAACSDAEEPLCSRPLTFAVSEEPQARGTAYGTTWGTTDGSAFDVVAYYYAPGSLTPQPLMENTVTRDGSRWGYSPVVYWPVEGSADFFSYAPACEGARQEFQRFTPIHTDYQAILADCHVPASQITTIHALGTDNSAITAYPHDAANQYDLMMAYLRDVQCAEQAVTSHVNMNFVHVMAGVRLDLQQLKENAATKIPAGTQKIVIGLGRIRTGGTLAICEPATAGGHAEVVWTLDGHEGTFYETYKVTWNDAKVTAITREETGKPDGATPEAWETDATFFFPPQEFESGLTVTAYFYNSENKRISYHTLTLPYTGADAINGLKRGQILTLNIQ